MRKPTPMPDWLEKQFDAAERTVATWSLGKQQAAGIMNPRRRPIEYFTDVNTKLIHEHITQMSFNNDSGNYAFTDWWAKEGQSMFNKWCEDNIDQLIDDYD
jgi:hypothetical protein